MCFIVAHKQFFLPQFLILAEADMFGAAAPPSVKTKIFNTGVFSGEIKKLFKQKYTIIWS